MYMYCTYCVNKHASNFSFKYTINTCKCFFFSKQLLAISTLPNGSNGSYQKQITRLGCFLCMFIMLINHKARVLSMFIMLINHKAWVLAMFIMLIFPFEDTRMPVQYTTMPGRREVVKHACN